MRCPNQYQWEIFVDGELPPVKTLQMETHLKECPLCNRLVARLWEEAELLSLSLAATPVPHDLAVMINKRIAGRGSSELIWLFLVVMGVAGVLGALSEGWWLFEKLRDIFQLFVGSDFTLQLALFFFTFILELANLAMMGNPVLPTLALLAVCVLWVQLKLQRGGRTYV